MKLADLSEATRQKIAKVRYDQIVEKHEGPFDWDCILNEDPEPLIFANRPDLSPTPRQQDDNPEFLIIDNRPVLLPIPLKHHPNIEIVRTIWSADGNSVTILLTDTTYGSEWYEVGYLAVCDKVAGEEFWLAILYHEWFVIEPDPIFSIDPKSVSEIDSLKDSILSEHDTISPIEGTL
jgi:hypothetical protein